MAEDPRRERETLPLAEERAVVTKEQVASGRVRVRAVTEEVTQTVHDDLDSEVVEIERVRVNRELTPGDPLPQTRTEGDVTIVPVFEEILVVEKRLVLREEVRLRRTLTQEHVEQPVALRKQRAEIERLDPTHTETSS